MVEYILGNYLVEKGKITTEQLKETLVKQDSVRVKLGLIAVAEGMMTLAQTDEVNRLQAMMDQRFGDIAVSKGYLTDEQIAKLLNKQGNTYLMFIQALVDSGYVSMNEIEALVDEFRHENGYSNSELDALKSDDVDRIVPLFVPEEGKQFTEVIAIAIKTIVRLIDRHVSVGKAEMVSAFPAELQVSQGLAGSSGIIDCFSEGNGALLKLCCGFAKEEFPELDFEAIDAAGEFLNCVNGLYASALSRKGVFLELMPPCYEEATEQAKSDICRIPIYIGDSLLYFTVAELV